MEIGTEISKKIRSAIKAKLVELGAYVDDELPDYIMVMVANKKTHAQMVDDLKLFLNENAEKFSLWLHDLLNKLQAISLEKEEKRKEVENKPLTSQSSISSDAQKPEKVLSHSDEKPKSIEHHTEAAKGKTWPTEASVDKASMSKATSVSIVALAAPPATAKEATSIVVPAVKVAPAAAQFSVPVPEEDVAMFQVQADTDEFSEELLLMENQQETTKKPVAAVRLTGSQLKDGSHKIAEVPARVRKEVQPTSRVKDATAVQSPAQTRKRRLPSMVVGTVRSDEVEEEPYDPFNPSVGNVASVVRVTPRRSSVPTQIQANKSLLLKAVSDAEKSVLSAGSTGVPSRALIRPIPRTGNIRDRLSVAAVADVRQRLNAAGAASDGRTKRPHSPALTDARVRISGSATAFSRPRLVENTTSAIRKHTSPAASWEKQVAALSERQSNAGRGVVQDARLKLTPSSTADTESRLSGTTAYSVKPVDKSDKSHLQLQKHTITRIVNVPEYVPTRKAVFVVRPEEVVKESLLDSRVVKMGEENGSESPGEAAEDLSVEVEEYVPEESSVAPIPEILTDDSPDDYSFINEDIDVSGKTDVSSPVHKVPAPTQPTRHVQDVHQPFANTKFIVTLDGIDPCDFDSKEVEEMEEEIVEEMAEEMIELTKEDKISQAKMEPPKIKPFSICLKDSDDEEIDHGSPMKKARMVERCKFWPACSNGNSCAFHHPTSPCLTFPNCKFGDKCLFIHPNCKFDARCSRPDCPYTHASRRHPVAMTAAPLIALPHPKIPVILAPPQPSSQIQCRFFPKCTNMNCSFAHPKVCRYGVACLNKSTCPYYHPPLPGKDKMKWAAVGPSFQKSLTPAVKKKM